MLKLHQTEADKVQNRVIKAVLLGCRYSLTVPIISETVVALPAADLYRVAKQFTVLQNAKTESHGQSKPNEKWHKLCFFFIKPTSLMKCHEIDLGKLQN